MNAATHPDREELAAYVLGTLPEDRAERLEEHLAACPACEETIRGMEGLSDPLIEGLGRAGQVESRIVSSAPTQGATVSWTPPPADQPVAMDVPAELDRLASPEKKGQPSPR